MNLAITLAMLAAQLAFAGESEQPTDITIGRPVQGVRIGASTHPLTGPLDSTISLELVDVTLASLLDEVGKQTKTEYILIQGVGQCRVSAFIRDLTTRELLQMTLEVGGLTYQSAGRSNRYIVTRRKGGPACEQAGIAPAGTCFALEDKKIAAECKNGSLSSLVKLLYSQAGGNFLVWNELVNQPVTIQLRNIALTKALNRISKEHSIDVKKVGKKNSFLFVARERKQAPPEMEKSTQSAHVGLIYKVPPRYEPPANPNFKEEMPNQGIERPAPR